MTPYVEQHISKGDRALFAEIKKAVVRMKDIELGLNESGTRIILSCHILARAVAKVFPVSVKDGYFAVNYAHSWVETAEGNLVDVYPVAVIGGPIMFCGNAFSPKRRIYTRVSARELTHVHFSSNSFRRSVRRVTKALYEALGSAR